MDFGIILIDTRPISICINGLLMQIDFLAAHDTDVVVKEYSLCQLLADTITYGHTYGGIPGNPHYTHISDNLSRRFGCQIDDEYLHFVLGELEHAVYNIYRIDTALLEVIKVRHHLLVARKIPDAIY